MDDLKLQLQADRKNTQYNETQRAATNARSKMSCTFPATAKDFF